MLSRTPFVCYGLLPTTLMLTNHVSSRLWTPFHLPLSLVLHIFLSHGLSSSCLSPFISWHLLLSVSFCLRVVWASLTCVISDPPSGQSLRAGLGRRGTIPLRQAKAVCENGGQALLLPEHIFILASVQNIFFFKKHLIYFIYNSKTKYINKHIMNTL